MDTLSIAIVIVNWNSFYVTAQCLESLKTVNYPRFEIILIDNGSSDGSGNRLKEKFPEVTLIESRKNLGFTGGNNLGIQYALDVDHDLVMLLNNDTVVTPWFIRYLTNRLISENLAAIQPKIMYNYDRSIIWNAGGKYVSFFTLTKTRGERVKDKGQFDHLLYTDWITGCCFLIWADVIRKIGLLDDKFFIYHEDADWSLKIRNLGMKMAFEPNSIIYHEAGMSDSNRDKHGEGNVSPFSHYQNVRNQLYMIRRYARGINLIGSWGYQIIKLAGFSLYFLIKGRFTKLKFVIRGIRDGLTT
ncbi:glycosyltransferase family 2 protein [Roseivirga thermotolerans]|uniref:Glycosyltransferase 2-like domain-containing protein n=1 Tax=Roseivirga thermotolerans TaxID=1758176 RepID=A0ABQ3I0M8_9BACT|nr:glycosyltransferase family 2 protein [Roseivirga thermotolerans]GHE53348.1 hypothetical protein GCM10011340_04830 [Roseivirga thermotolerans]